MPCIQYGCHVWAGAPSCQLELLDKLQKRICRTASPSLITSLEPLALCQNVVSLSPFYRYYFGRWGSLTMASTGKFVYMAHHFIMLWLNPFGLRVDREGWWFEHSVS